MRYLASSSYTYHHWHLNFQFRTFFPYIIIIILNFEPLPLLGSPLSLLLPNNSRSLTLETPPPSVVAQRDLEGADLETRFFQHHVKHGGKSGFRGKRDLEAVDLEPHLFIQQNHRKNTGRGGKGKRDLEPRLFKNKVKKIGHHVKNIGKGGRGKRDLTTE
ncbi:unnamed protein product [Clonostachys chloroleuca]|uniref:Uncharacterized protein n=1 Tax=Clonostachys chloroleuca TaxID=1926264 RepID=A0AA35M3B8_9HYPO|nr:unnamed protein product [Clonostachys chloroleuca]